VHRALDGPVKKWNVHDLVEFLIVEIFMQKLILLIGKDYTCLYKAWQPYLYMLQQDQEELGCWPCMIREQQWTHKVRRAPGQGEQCSSQMRRTGNRPRDEQATWVCNSFQWLRRKTTSREWQLKEGKENRSRLKNRYYTVSTMPVLEIKQRLKNMHFNIFNFY